MKKIVLLSAFALTAFVSQSLAASNTPCTGDYAGFCYWPPKGDDEGGCYTINKGDNDANDCEAEYNNCVENGTLYYNVTHPAGTWGAGKTCTELGGEWSKIGNDPNYNNGVPLFCKWATSCERVLKETEKEKCLKDGSLYEGEGGCATGTFIGGKDPNAVVLGCCKWNTETNCYNIMSGKDEEGVEGTTKVANCKTGSNVFHEGACPTNTTDNCPVPGSSSSGTVVGGQSSSSSNGSTVTTYTYCIIGGMCLEGPFTMSECATTMKGAPTNSCPNSSASGTPGNSSSSSAGSSNPVNTFTYCISQEDLSSPCLHGPFTLAECITLGRLPSNNCPDNVGSPILLSRIANANALSAMRNAVNLQATGSTTVQIFDLKGNTVRALKFAQGNYILPLTDLPRGLYIVKAGSASWKQTIKVTVK